MLTPFHLALNVGNLDQTRVFYGTLLGATEGRSTETWVDFDFFGHQLSLHLGSILQTQTTGKVGDHMVPMPHFGIVLHLPDWRALRIVWRDKMLTSSSPRRCDLKTSPANNGRCFSGTRSATRSR